MILLNEIYLMINILSTSIYLMIHILNQRCTYLFLIDVKWSVKSYLFKNKIFPVISNSVNKEPTVHILFCR